MDTASCIVAAVTFLLFVAALFEKGFARELSSEAGVFPVSVKPMMLAYKSHKSSERVEARLDEIADALKKK